MDLPESGSRQDPVDNSAKEPDRKRTKTDAGPNMMVSCVSKELSESINWLLKYSTSRMNASIVAGT